MTLGELGCLCWGCIFQRELGCFRNCPFALNTRDPYTRRVQTYHLFKWLQCTPWSLSGPFSNSPLPSVTLRMIPIFLNILELFLKCQFREPQDFPQTDLSRPSALAEAGLAHRMHSEATNVRIGLGVQGESGRATFHSAEMTVESLIFIEQQLWYATKMFQESWGCFIRSKSWQGQMPTRIFILWTPISAVGWHFFIIIVFLKLVSSV